MAKDIQSKVRNIISEIEEKASDGNYIYRGERKCYCRVSSNLWRELHAHERDKTDYNDVIQESYLREARRYGGNLHQDDFELASELQHLGGETNLIDFTTDYLVALFFACDGSHKKPGRVILLKQTERIKNKYKIKEPRSPINRVIAQKSMFVRPSRGFIEQRDIKTVCVKAELKEPILTYLRKYHGIYTQTIYNDLHGYIKHQEIHHKAYSEYRRGQLARFYGAMGISIDGINLADVAIKRLNKAIKLNPLLVEAYFERAHAYWLKEDSVDFDIDKVIEDFNRAIELNPDHAFTHFQRGRVYRRKGCDDRAIKDFNRAIELDPDDAFVYAERGLVYFDNGCDNRAIEDFNRAIELGNNSVRGHLEAAQTRRESEGADEVESIN